MKVTLHGSIRCVLWWLFCSAATANTEKVIFVAPQSISVPIYEPSLSDLNLRILTSQENSVRTKLPRRFRNSAEPLGPASWYFLSSLNEGQRYELRVCWPATVG